MNTETENISYGEALSELKVILAKIESEEMDVDELSGEVHKASKLLQICRSKLLATNEEIKKVLDELPE